MLSHKAAALATAVALCALLTGCGKTYRAETVLHEDGSVDRAIYQPAEDMPAAALEAKTWKQTTFALKPGDMDLHGWPDALTLLPAQAKDQEHPYLVAWNHFASVKDLPETVLFQSPAGSGLPDGKLERDLTRTDLGFVEAFVWRETLTDLTTLEEMHKARAELADLMIPFGQEVFTEAVGTDYDGSELVLWMKTDGKAWFDEATELLFLGGAAKQSAARQELEKELTAGMERRGLKLKADGQWLKGDDLQHAWQDFVAKFVGEKVKQDGKPVGRETALKWLGELNSKDGGRFKLAAQKVIDRKYGGEEAFQKRVGVLIVRILGGYTISAPLDFTYTMTFPGPVVETNGELLGDGDKVRWRFHGSDAYPLGYSMEARCLLVPEEVRKFLGRAKPLSDRDALMSYVDSVRADDVLLKVMRRCRKDKTLDPLYDYLAGLKNIHAEKVLKLLKAS